MGCIFATGIELSYQKWKDSVENLNYRDFGDLYKPPRELPRSSYLTGPALGDGIMGIVHAGIEKDTKKFVALKFFGYFEKVPKIEDIEREICFLMAMKGVEGIVQIEGVFMDTSGGMIEGIDKNGKSSIDQYPVVST